MSINPILAALNNHNTTKPQVVKPNINNPATLLSEFANFKKSFADKDPYAVLNQLRSSGKMTDKQFEELKSQAESLMFFLK